MHYLTWEFNQLLVNSARQEIKGIWTHASLRLSIYDTESGRVFGPVKAGSTFCHPISVTISVVWLFIVCCSSLHCQNRGLVQRSSDYSNTCWSHVSCCMLVHNFFWKTMLMLLGLSRFVCLGI